VCDALGLDVKLHSPARIMRYYTNSHIWHSNG
jgi:hypothetical protein